MQYIAPDALERARRIRVMLFDVDGVLTDGQLWYGPMGVEVKAFHGFDGHGLKMLADSGIATGILTGRSSGAVATRAKELGVVHLLQGVADKRAEWEKLLSRLSLAPEACGYMGDDLVDLPVLMRCGLACAPREAPEDVRQRVHYIASAAAGFGAVREVCELLMRAQGTLGGMLDKYLR
jgi:3-deoxy-D-manno-octulosonate 8-phosphate phosphatase (KDO 8-P phosphatase)